MPAANSKIAKIWIHGSSGRMGQAIQEAIVSNRKLALMLTGGSDHVFHGYFLHEGEAVTAKKLAEALKETDLVIDFSEPEANKILCSALELSKAKNKAVLIGTTGLSPKLIERWKKLAKSKSHRILLAPNTSLGILVLTQTLKNITRLLNDQGYDIELTESHHRNKVDAPSGTAKFLATEMQRSDPRLKISDKREGKRKASEIGMHAIRGGSVIGEHTISFLGDSDELHFRHRATSRQLFAQGALVLSKWLLKKKSGFYELRDIAAEDLL